MRECTVRVVVLVIFCCAVSEAAESASVARDDDRMLAAVVKALVKERDKKFCVGVSDAPHGWEGPWKMPSAWLQKRLLRDYRNVGFPEGSRPCYSPFYLVGPVEPFGGGEWYQVEVMDM